MRKWAAMVVAGLVMSSGAAFGHEKRADKCGCHHQYGLRHCHPKLKTKHCEAPVKGSAPRACEPDAKTATPGAKEPAAKGVAL